MATSEMTSLFSALAGLQYWNNIWPEEKTEKKWVRSENFDICSFADIDRKYQVTVLIDRVRLCYVSTKFCFFLSFTNL